MVAPDVTDPEGRVTQWEPAQPGHVYVIGADFAYGLEGRDRDTAVVLDCSTTPVRQVAEAEGRWGPDGFDLVLYGLHRLYAQAFIVGEAQVGLPVLRRLWDHYNVRSLYTRRNEIAAGRKWTDSLGYHRAADHATLWALNRAIRDRAVVLRSSRLIDEMTQLQWYSPKDKDGLKAGDATLKMRLTGGGSPDLIRALEYAWHGALERPRWAMHMGPPRWAPGTMGDFFGHNDVLPPQAPPPPPERRF